MKSTKAIIAGLGVAVAILIWSAPASAHVHVVPDIATKGSSAILSFEVPSEEDNANTTKLEVDIPTDHPIASVDVQPTDGWSYAIATTDLAQPIQTDDGSVSQAVSKITWTATNGGLKPGEFTEFHISAGPLPGDANQIEFKALQTYSNGDVVRWIDDPLPNGQEPDHPAPILKLTPAATNSTSAATTKSDSSHGTAVAALIVAVVGGVIAIIALIIAASRGHKAEA